METEEKKCKLSVYRSDYELLINKDTNIISSCPSPGF